MRPSNSKSQPLARAASPPDIIYLHVGPGRLPSCLAAKLAMKIRIVRACIGNPNEFSQVLRTHLIDIFIHLMHTCPRLPPITPDYTRLHPTFNPDYPTPRVATRHVWMPSGARQDPHIDVRAHLVAQVARLGPLAGMLHMQQQRSSIP